jgi:hypothetical protein
MERIPNLFGYHARVGYFVSTFAGISKRFDCCDFGISRVVHFGGLFWPTRGTANFSSGFARELVMRDILNAAIYCKGSAGVSCESRVTGFNQAFPSQPRVALPLQET